MALPPLAVPEYKYWEPGPVLNQGGTSQCVGYAWRQFLLSEPLMTKDGLSAHEIYCRACALDVWSQNNDCDVNFGTDVGSAAKALKAAGHLAEYRWSWKAEEVRLWVKLRGPVVIGVPWYNSMYETDKLGNLDIDPKSGVSGGHAVLVRGADDRNGKVHCVNSWGEEWGAGGFFWLTNAQLEYLFRDGASVAVSGIEKAVS